MSQPVEATEEAPQFLHYDLVPGTEHTFSVRARNALGVGGMSELLTEATANAVPATPLTPTTSTGTNPSGAEEVLITIAAVAYSGTLGLPLASLSYEVEEVLEGSSPLLRSSTLLGGSGGLTLSRGREVTQDYKYRVRAVSPAGPSEWSGWATVLNDYSKVPTIPASVNTSAAAGGGVRISWKLAAADKNEGAEFVVRLRCGAAVTAWASNCTDVDARVRAAQCTAEPVDGFYRCATVVDGATALATYDVSVAGVNDAGTSLFSPASSVNTTRTVPGAPARFQIGLTTDTSLELLWLVPPSNGHLIRGYLASHASDAGEEDTFSLSHTAIRHPTALTCAAMLAPASAAEQGALYNQGAPLSYALPGLAMGTSYRINMTACNELGEGASSCVCAREMCGEREEGAPLNGCVEEPTPAHTHAVPARPSEPIDAVDVSLDERKKREIFMRWTPPDDHGSRITQTEISITESSEVNGTSTELTQTFQLPASSTQPSFNLSGLQPATQYRCSVRMRNAYGWSAMSLDAWLWTRPTVPEVPPPTCERDVMVDAVEDTQLRFDVQPADDNGQVSHSTLSVISNLGTTLLRGVKQLARATSLTRHTIPRCRVPQPRHLECVLNAASLALRACYLLPMGLLLAAYGQAVLEYQLNVSYGGRLYYSGLVGASLEERSVQAP